MLREQPFKFVEKLLGNIRRAPQFAKVRDDPPLRFDVTLALRHMALRHLQFGLTVHSTALLPKRPQSDWRAQ